MGANDSAINDQVLHVWVVCEVLMHLLPDLVVAPAGKALVNAVPLTIFSRQQAPLTATPCDPKYALDKPAALNGITNVSAGTITQKGDDL